MRKKQDRIVNVAFIQNVNVSLCNKFRRVVVSTAEQ